MNMDVPAGYKSDDVIDRRNGEKPTVGDKVRDLGLKVVHDYNDNIGKNSYYNNEDMKPAARKSSTGKRSTGKR
jgi:hypothetical protein